MSAEAVGSADASTEPRSDAPFLALPRVMRLLDRRAALTVVRGMQGYGKSAHIMAWIRSQPSPLRVLWLTATSCSDPDSEIVAEIKKFSGTTGTPSALISRLPGHGPQLDPEPDYSVIVIDDAHHFTDRDALQWLIGLVQHSGIRVILNSRGPHPIQKAATGRAELSVIPAGLFLFRPEETAALASTMGIELSPVQLGELHEEFGGWPAALRLVLTELAGSGRAAGQDGLPLDRARRYLRDTVLPGVMSTDILEVTMRFALAEQLSYRLIRDLADDQDPERLIAMIETAGFAEVQEHGSERFLVLPRFVRNTLREVYSERHPEEALALHRRLSDWYAGRPSPDHMLFSLRHAAAAADWQRFDGLWSREGFRLALSRPTEVLAVIDELPSDVIEARPSVTIVQRGLSAALDEPAISERWVSSLHAYAHVSARFGPSELRRMSLQDALLVGAGHIVGRRLGLPHADSAAITQTVDAALSKNAAHEDPGPVLSWYYLQRGNAELAQLHLPESAHWYLLSWQSRTSATSASITSVAANAALAHAIGAQPQLTRQWLGRIQNVPAPISWSPHRMAPGSSLAKAWLALDELSPELDRIMTDIGADPFVESEFWPLAAYLRAQYELLVARPAPALGRLGRFLATRIPRSVRTSPADSIFLARARMDLLLASGQAQRAQRIAYEQHVESHPVITVPLAWAELLTGRLSAARRIADQALWHDRSSDRERIELLLVKALARYRMGEQATATELARQAVELHQATGIIRPFAYLSEAQRALLLGADALSLGAEASTRLARVQAPYPDEAELVILTHREQQLATLLSATSSRQAMADELYVSINTVKKQLATLYRKLGVTTRDDALVRLARAGLLPHPAPSHANPRRR